MKKGRTRTWTMTRRGERLPQVGLNFGSWTLGFGGKAGAWVAGNAGSDGREKSGAAGSSR